MLIRKKLYSNELVEKLGAVQSDSPGQWTLKEVKSKNFFPSFKMFLDISGKKFQITEVSYRRSLDPDIKIFALDLIKEKIHDIQNQCHHLKFDVKIHNLPENQHVQYQAQYDNCEVRKMRIAKNIEKMRENTATVKPKM